MFTRLLNLRVDVDCATLPRRHEVEASNIVIICLFQFSTVLLLCYLNLGIHFSMCLHIFASSSNSSCEPLTMPLHVSTLIGDSLKVDRVYRSCVVTFAGYET